MYRIFDRHIARTGLLSCHGYPRSRVCWSSTAALRHWRTGAAGVLSGYSRGTHGVLKGYRQVCWSSTAALRHMPLRYWRTGAAGDVLTREYTRYALGYPPPSGSRTREYPGELRASAPSSTPRMPCEYPE